MAETPNQSLPGNNLPNPDNEDGLRFGGLSLGDHIEAVGNTPTRYEETHPVPEEEDDVMPIAVRGAKRFTTRLHRAEETALEAISQAQQLDRELTALEEAHSQSHQLNKELEKNLNKDALTGLLNREGLTKEFDKLKQKATNSHPRRSNQPTTSAALFVDLDGFKDVNDTYGHHAGDDVLREVAKRLGSSVREGDLVARWSGDEFVIVLPHLSNDEAIQKAEGLRKVIATDKVDASIGLRMFDLFENPENIDVILHNADQAMYAAKEGGKHQVVVYTDDLRSGQSKNTRQSPRSTD